MVRVRIPVAPHVRVNERGRLEHVDAHFREIEVPSPGGVPDSRGRELPEIEPELPEWWSDFKADQPDVQLHPDGTVTMYHGTTRERAEEIRRTGVLRADPDPANPDPDNVYVHSNPNVGASYGDGTVIAVRVPVRDLVPDEAFETGWDFRIAQREYRPVRVVSGGVTKRYLPITISPTLHTVMTELDESGHHSLIVGGAVRDALLGGDPKDIDVEVYGTSYAELEQILSKHGTVNVVGQAFGVIKFRDPDGNEYDFSLPRRDNRVGVGHRGFETEFDPDISFEEAAARRDFTWNALAYDPISGELHDYFGGEKDLQDKVIRHTSEAFAEDPLRVLRGMQFAARYDMTVAPETAELARSIVDRYGELPTERVSEEFMKLATRAPHPGKGIQFLHDTGWDVHFPALRDLWGAPQEPEWHPEGDVAQHTMFAADMGAAIADREGLTGDDRAVMVFASILHDVGKPTATQMPTEDSPHITSHGHAEAGGPVARQFLRDAGIKQSIIDKVVPLVEAHMDHLNYREGAGGASPKAVRRLARRISPATIQELVWVSEADSSGRPPKPPKVPLGSLRIKELAEESRVLDGAPQNYLLGRDVMPYYGNEGGPHIGEVLREAFELQMEGQLHSREEALAWLDERMVNRIPDGPARWEGEPYTVHFSGDPTKDRRNYVARITGGDIGSRRFEREFLAGAWQKVGEQTLSDVTTGKQRPIGTWIPVLPPVDGLYEMQVYRNDRDQFGQRKETKTRTLFAVENGVAHEIREAFEDPEDYEHLMHPLVRDSERTLPLRVKTDTRLTLYRGEGSPDNPSYYPATGPDARAGAWWTSDLEAAKRYAAGQPGGRVYEIEVEESEVEKEGLNFLIMDPEVRARRRLHGVPSYASVPEAETDVRARFGYADFSGLVESDLPTLNAVLAQVYRLIEEYPQVMAGRESVGVDLTGDGARFRFRGIGTFGSDSIARNVDELSPGAWAITAVRGPRIDSDARTVPAPIHPTQDPAQAGFGPYIWVDPVRFTEYWGVMTAPDSPEGAMVHEMGHVVAYIGDGSNNARDRVLRAFRRARYEAYQADGIKNPERQWMRDTDSIYAAESEDEGFAELFYILNFPGALEETTFGPRTAAAIRRLTKIRDKVNAELGVRVL